MVEKLENAEGHQHTEQNKKHTFSIAVEFLATLWSLNKNYISWSPCIWI